MPWGVAAAAVGAAGAVYSSKQAGKAAEKSAEGADAASQVQWDMYDQSRKDQLPWIGTGQNALRQLAALNGVQYSEQSASDISDPTLVEISGGIPTMNNELYQTDPVYRRAWDNYLNQHIARFGGGYTEKSDSGVINTAIQQIMASDPEYQNRKANQTSAGNFSQSATATPDYSAFYNSPDYQFAFDEGNRALKGSLAARGLSGSGRALKELTRYGQGVASQQLNTYRNALAAMAGVGQSTAANVGQQGIQTGQIVGQNTQNAADARASGYLGKANAWNSAINQGVGLAAYGYGNGWWGSKQ